MRAPRPSICPICRKPTSHASRPFCSPRCAEIDLGRWFTESYVVPGPPPSREELPSDEE